jgi:DNA polymerase-3 subunit beta
LLDKNITVSSDGSSFKNSSHKINLWDDNFIVPRQAQSPKYPWIVFFSCTAKDSQLIFSVDNIILSTRLIEGQFPDFKKIIPVSSSTTVSLNKEEFLKSIKLASVLAREGTNTVKLAIKKDEIEIHSESQNAGTQKSALPAKVDGEEVEISFNYRFIEEFLNVVDGEEVILEFNKSDSPGVFKDPKDPDFLHLIMPIKSQ